MDNIHYYNRFFGKKKKFYLYTYKILFLYFEIEIQSKLIVELIFLIRLIKIKYLVHIFIFLLSYLD
jgi:hypothetical protein